MITSVSNPAVLKQKFSLMSEPDFISSALELKNFISSSPDISAGHYRNLALVNLYFWCRVFYIKKYRGQKTNFK